MGNPLSHGESPELTRAYERVFDALFDLKHAGVPKLPPARTLDEFFASIRGRNSDDPFLSENPGP